MSPISRGQINAADAEVIHTMPFADYAASPETHATALRHLLVSPLAYKRALEQPQTETDAMRGGQANHTAVLEPLQFLRKFALWEGGRRYGKEWEAFKASAAGKTIVTSEQYETAIKLQAAVRGHKVASALLGDGGKAEVSIRYTDATTGVRIKARIDWLGKAIVDLKTTSDVSARTFGASAARYGYALQLAVYQAAAEAAGFGSLPCKLIAAQVVEPFDVVVYDCSGEGFLGVGRSQLAKALALLEDCRLANAWPGIAPDKEVDLSLPVWADASNDDELTFDGEALPF